MSERSNHSRRRFIAASATIGLTSAVSGCNGVLGNLTGGSPGQSISVGAEVQGQITSDGPRDPVYDDRSALYTFTGSAGEEVQITMRSNAFDPYVLLTRSDGTQVDEHDDGGGGFDTQFTATLPADGEYDIWAQSLSGEATGSFTLRLGEAPTVTEAPAASDGAGWSGPPDSARHIGYGDEVEGTITESSPRDPVYDDLAVALTFDGSAGDTIRVNMQSDALDPYVVLTGPDGRTVGQQDDGGESFNTLFTETLTDDGTHTLWAGSFSGTATGPFTLSLEQV